VDRKHLKSRPLPADLIDALVPHTLPPATARALLGAASPSPSPSP